jgi:hypothetical protein
MEHEVYEAAPQFMDDQINIQNIVRLVYLKSEQAVKVSYTSKIVLNTQGP